MSMGRSRADRFHAHPAPLAADMPAVVAVTALAVLTWVALTPLVVRGLILAVTAGEFAWPAGHLQTAVLRMWRGDFGAGLPDAVADQLPPAPVMWVAVGFGELVLLAFVAYLGWCLRIPLGFGSARGLATAKDADAALGVSTLRSKAAVIRPDLHPPTARRRRRR